VQTCEAYVYSTEVHLLTLKYLQSMAGLHTCTRCAQCDGEVGHARALSRSAAHARVMVIMKSSSLS
jgi:hypothetical protein